MIVRSNRIAVLTEKSLERKGSRLRNGTRTQMFFRRKVYSSLNNHLPGSRKAWRRSRRLRGTETSWGAVTTKCAAPATRARWPVSHMLTLLGCQVLTHSVPSEETIFETLNFIWPQNSNVRLSIGLVHKYRPIRPKYNLIQTKHIIST